MTYLPWIAVVLLVVGSFLMTRKKITGQWFWVASNAALLAYSIWTQQWAFVTISGFYFLASLSQVICDLGSK